jgi:transcriptional regulator with XRE-family HTH domain
MSAIISKNDLDGLRDPESRQYFYEEHIETGLPVQIRELRKKRKMTQAKLADVMGCDQSNISEWENPNYEYTPQIGTLMRLANAFDVPLIVRFGSWQELLEWDKGLSPEKVAPESFEEFAERIGKEDVSISSIVKEMAGQTFVAVSKPTFVTEPKPTLAASGLSVVPRRDDYTNTLQLTLPFHRGEFRVVKDSTRASAKTDVDDTPNVTVNFAKSAVSGRSFTARAGRR